MVLFLFISYKFRDCSCWASSLVYYQMNSFTRYSANSSTRKYECMSEDRQAVIKDWALSHFVSDLEAITDAWNFQVTAQSDASKVIM